MPAIPGIHTLFQQKVSSDTMSFAFKATAIDHSVDPIGTFNTYTYAANTNTATIAVSAPTQNTSDMNINGIRVFGRIYSAISTAASPARVDVFIGKGLKSTEVNLYASTGKTAALNYDMVNFSTTDLSGSMKSYNENTGILTITAGFDGSGVSTIRYVGLNISLPGSATSGYFVFNASKF